MSTLYPEISSQRRGAYWPDAMNSMKLGSCPACDAGWVTYRSYCELDCSFRGRDNSNDYEHLLLPGKCWAEKTQLTLTLEDTHEPIL